ncbi:hypothetical protein [Tuberibacillus sp. Marseille-P3662]|uniref:hypothetical protein n=1 Tax=Tuberibacillus sp. Marseille-P3662 TaxID=1965358 RepID=UPI000A1CAB98|nr:hypothetical protein [Tuberibacillus sp. Marseille-P3662]
MNEQQLYHKIYVEKEKLDHLISNYWSSYSNIDTWYFWVNVASVLIPFILLYIAVDKKRLFEICFFGYTVHMIWANVDTMLSQHNYLVHPHTLTYLLPFGITITAVVFPVTFMLLYQYCTNRDKNFYIYTIIASLIFSYRAGGLSDVVGLLNIHKGMNFFYLFLIDVAIVYISFWMTKLFSKFMNMNGRTQEGNH